jgi:YihY family inner membrane protein
MPRGLAHREGRSIAVIRRRGVGTFVGDVIVRYRDADGASHTRALAYQSMFVMLSGFIGFVGLTSVFDLPSIRRTIEQLAQSLSPGPSGRLLQEAAQQGSEGGTSAMIAGLASALVAGTLAMAQMERSANRIHGLREDRPAVRRYLVAFLLSISAGVLLAAGGLLLVAGRTIADGAGWNESFQPIWSVVRWPIGILVALTGVFLLYRTAPRERLATARELVVGAAVAVMLWSAFTVLLAAYFSLGSESAQTYGPLLAIVALLLWSLLTSLALHLGIAVASELHSAGAWEDRAIRIPDSAEMSTTRGVRS